MDAAADFVAELIAAANALEDITVSWRLAGLARRWLRPDRRDLPWALVREAELEERDFNDPLTAGIPVDDDDYRELRRVLAGLPVDVAGQFRCAGPETGAEARELLTDVGLIGVFSSGLWRRSIEVLGARREELRREGLVAMDAFFSAVRSRLEAITGEFDAAAADLDAALALLPRMAAGSNQAMQVLVVPMLRDVLGGKVLDPAVADVLLDFAAQPDTRWAGLVLRLGAARGFAYSGQRERAWSILDAVMPILERAPAWAPNAPIAFAYAADVAWVLEDARVVSDLERHVRSKWLDPDIGYPEVDARWSYALLCALDGRPDDARHWFAEARRVLAARGCRAASSSGVDHDAAEMELRLGEHGDAVQFAACIAAARSRCTHPAMAAWLPRLEALEQRAREIWPG